MRLSSSDSVADCMGLMKDFWRIMEPNPPNLVISVVGGAKNYKLDGDMRETFSNGIIKVCLSLSEYLLVSVKTVTTMIVYAVPLHSPKLSICFHPTVYLCTCISHKQIHLKLDILWI